jgi:hypothetical protein
MGEVAEPKDPVYERQTDRPQGDDGTKNDTIGQEL